MAKDTFKIAKGKVEFDTESVNNLAFALEEGYSDQDVLFWGKVVKDNIEKLEKVL